MRQPTPPRLEDFGLSEDEYSPPPRLLGDRLTERAISRISAAIGAAVGLGAIWGFLQKTDSVFTGLFFGVLIGIVVFLLAGFFGGMLVGLAVNIVSGSHKFLIIMVDGKARRAYRYDDAMARYRAEKKAYDGRNQSC